MWSPEDNDTIDIYNKLVNEIEEFSYSFLDNLAGKWNAIIFESKEDGKLITLKAFEEMIAFD